LQAISIRLSVSTISGVVLSELIGFRGFHDKVNGFADMNFVQQGTELSYLILHDPDFRRVRLEHLEHLVETDRGIRLRFGHVLDNLDEEHKFDFNVISAAPSVDPGRNFARRLHPNPGCCCRKAKVRICSRPHGGFGNARVSMGLAPAFAATSKYDCPRCGYTDNFRNPRLRSEVHRVKWPFAHSA
jgi:hypothetical protein